MSSKTLTSAYCCILSLLLVCFLAGACVSKGESDLRRALSAAVKDQKISAQKMERILAEYDELREDDKKLARDYANLVLNAIEMGGDSSHIDAARKQMLPPVKGKIKV